MSIPLRIAHINTEKTWRGGEQQMFNLVRILAERGHSNVCFARSRSALAQRLRSEKIQVNELKPIFEWDLICARRLSKLLKREKIDVLQVHSAHAVVLAALSKLFWPLPTIATRRVDFHVNRNPFSRWKYSQMDRVVAISEAVKNVLLEDGIPPEKITVVHSGVDGRRLDEVVPMTKREMGFADDIVVGQIAALADHKDQSTLLRAVALLKSEIPRLQLALVGEGPMRVQLEQEARDLGVNGFVTFFGFRNDALRFLAGFDVFCLSSKEEGLGTSLIDAMLLKVPIVATRAGGIPELIVDNVTGWLADPQNPVSLAAQLKKAIFSPDRARFTAAAHAKALGFTAEKTAGQMEQIYHELVRR